MEPGYIVNLYWQDLDSNERKVTQASICQSSLETDVKELAEFISNWIRQAPFARDMETMPRTLNISVMGSMPDPKSMINLKSPEQRLAEADSEEDRFHALVRVAKNSFEAEELEQAQAYALELQELAAEFKDSWHYADAMASVNTVLGRLAVRRGDIETAKKYLLAMGNSEGSPVLSSFGPNMSLAWDLLFKGERGVVLEFFELCRSFWSEQEDILDLWVQDVKDGRIPDFGANLDY